jgi:hypothetical protein
MRLVAICPRATGERDRDYTPPIHVKRYCAALAVLSRIKAISP